MLYMGCARTSSCTKKLDAKTVLAKTVKLMAPFINMDVEWNYVVDSEGLGGILHNDCDVAFSATILQLRLIHGKCILDLYYLRH
jgi:hypothetical protein